MVQVIGSKIISFKIIGFDDVVFFVVLGVVVLGCSWDRGCVSSVGVHKRDNVGEKIGNFVRVNRGKILVDVVFVSDRTGRIS